MSLFRSESPNLGPTTTVQELSGFGAGNPITSNFKPTTREIVSFSQTSATVPATQYVFVAPWQCQVLAVRISLQTLSTSGTLAVVKVPQASLPLAPTTAVGTSGVVNILNTSNVNIGSGGITVNSTNLPALNGGSGSPLVLNPGDQLALQFASTLTSLAGLYVQIEIAQIG